MTTHTYCYSRTLGSRASELLCTCPKSNKFLNFKVKILPTKLGECRDVSKRWLSAYFTSRNRTYMYDHLKFY